MLELLVQHGADIDQSDDDSQVPLVLAVECGKAEIVEKLLCLGATVNVAYQYGNTPSMTAAYYENLVIAKMILKAGADLDLYNEYEVEEDDDDAL